MGITERLRLEVLRFRARGGKQYELAIKHGISPSLLSATLSGARPCSFDPRIAAIGESLGLNADEVFVDDEELVES